jgi:hypothetical protein
LVSAFPFELAQGAALNLASGCMRQFIDEFDGSWIFERGYLGFDEILEV